MNPLEYIEGVILPQIDSQVGTSEPQQPSKVCSSRKCSDNYQSLIEELKDTVLLPLPPLLGYSKRKLSHMSRSMSAIISAPADEEEQQEATEESIQQVSKPIIRQKGRSKTYKIEKKIGEGISSVVYLAHEQDEASGETMPVAVKKFKKKKDHHFESEHKILATLQSAQQHMNLVRLIGADIATKEIKTAFYPRGSLLDLVLRKGSLEESEARFFFKGVCDATEHLQKKNICHRDLKLANILLDRECNPVLIDLGFAEFNRSDFTDPIGTQGYQAPEILCNEPYCGFAVDLFSLGVILFEMLLGRPPFKNACKLQDEMYQKFAIENSAFWEQFSISKNEQKISEHAKDLINLLLHDNPKYRIPLSRVYEHDWLQGPEDRVSVQA